MKRRFFFIGIFVFFLFLFSGCGPSEAEIATMTADAWTSTPPPTATFTPTPTPTLTPTPTPIPYGLTLLVAGEGGTPVAGAQVAIAEIEGENGMQTADEGGMTSWFNLPGETITLAVSAQGYFPSEMSETIERGDNQLIITLQRDPYGILPSEACAPGESLLYVEDLQDGEAQGWTEIEYRSQGWDLAPYPDAEGNFVISNPGATDTQIVLTEHDFDNAVWRIDFMLHDKPAIIFNWRFITQSYETEAGRIDASFFSVAFPDQAIRVVRQAIPLPEIAVLDLTRRLSKDEWHRLEISSYEGVLEIWMDGKRLVQYTDPRPLPAGPIGLELWTSETDQSMVYIDNMVVCELTAPFVPMPTPEPE